MTKKTTTLEKFAVPGDSGVELRGSIRQEVARWFHRDALPFDRTDPHLGRFSRKYWADN